MNSMRNKVQLIGNLGQDPEVKRFENGKVKASFSIATNESYKNSKGDKVTDTQWHTIEAWGKTAENVEKLLKKGKIVALQGKLTYRNYEDKQGVKKQFTSILANEFILLNRPETKKAV